ncbi:MAG: phytochelatin synthase [Alphaproteobacteria bacterium]|nr:phytochelatin synthase [Alphaproteobacteria bacterium]
MTRTRISLLVAAVLVLAAIGYALVPRGGDHLAGVVSIETTTTYRDPQLLAKAWQLPVAAAYHAAEFDYQRNQSFCGPTSVVDVLRSLGRKSSQEDVLKGSNVWTIFGYVAPAGMTLDEEAALLHLRTGMPVKILRDLDLATFRAELPLMNDPSRRYIVNFSRGPLFGHGHGHHSPILGYLEGEDLVFVGDVNRDYGGPWLVKADRLFQAVDTVDDSTGKKRGLLVVSVAPASP